jgi:hypothetical protein
MNSNPQNSRLFKSPDLADLVDQISLGLTPSSAQVSFFAVRDDAHIEQAGPKALVELNVEIVTKGNHLNEAIQTSPEMEKLPLTSEPSSECLVNFGVRSIYNPQTTNENGE